MGIIKAIVKVVDGKPGAEVSITQEPEHGCGCGSECQCEPGKCECGEHKHDEK